MWETSKMNAICHILGGKPAPKSNSGAFDSSGIPFVRMRDLGKYHLTTNLNETDDRISFAYAQENKIKPIPKGAILLPRSGSVALNHRAILAQDSIIVSHICALIVKDEEKINNRYLYYWLSKYDMSGIAKKTTGLDAINFSDLGNIDVSYPDIETQAKIVSILDKANVILEKREKTTQLYKKLLKAIFLDMFGDPVKNEKGWDLIKLGELGIWKSGGTPSRSNQKYFTGKIPWVTSGELNDVYISSTREHISQDAINSSNAKLIPSNSILIGMYDTAALKSSINTISLACNQAIAYSSIDEQKCNVLYVHTAIQLGKEFFKINQRGVRQQNLNLEMIRNISIPKPEISLQHEFVSKYKRLLAYSSKILAATEKGQLLLKSLSQEVFSERLTIDIDAELDALINAIDLNKKDVENKIDSLKKDQTLLQRLIDKLQEQDFKTSDQYEKSKYIVFRIMKDASDLIKQHFNLSDKKVTLEI